MRVTHLGKRLVSDGHSDSGVALVDANDHSVCNDINDSFSKSIIV